MPLITTLIILALAATVVSLVMGVVSMGRGGEFDQKHSGQFMNARLIFQGISIALLIIALVTTWTE